MASIEFVTIGAEDPGATERFIDEAFGVGDRVRAEPMADSVSGFRGFALSLVVAQPGDADALIDQAAAAGAGVLKPAKRSLWGYGGAVQGPDGTVWTVASESKKNTAATTGRVEDVVVQLGVEDPASSKALYVERGLEVAKSYGRRYVEFAPGPVTLTLNRRGDVAKAAGVSPEGSGTPGLTLHSDVGSFTDPDGFRWEPAPEA
jgi:hypothetical protein